MFNAEELQLLICGSEEGVDVADMKAHTEYAGGCEPSVDHMWTMCESGERRLRGRSCL